MCNNFNENNIDINILSENGEPLLTLNDSYLNDKIKEFTEFLNNFNNYFLILDNIINTRLNHSIDSICLSLHNSSFLNEHSYKDLNINLEMVLFNTFNLLFNFNKNKYVIFDDNNEKNVIIIFTKNNNYYSLVLDSDDNIILSKYESLFDLTTSYELDKEMLILEDEINNHINYLLSN